MSSSYDVLIAGAGPAGSALAIHLATAGVRVALVERARFPRPKPCADYLGPEALRHLSALGVLAAADRAGRPVVGTTVTASRGARLSGCLAEASSKHPPFRPTGLALSRTVLDALLAEEAVRRGTLLLEGTMVVDLLRDGNTVTGCAVRGPGGRTTLRARVTVGADGLRSVVARRAGYHHQTSLKRLAFVQCLRGIEGVGDRIELHVGASGYVGINRLGEDLSNVALVVPAARVRSGIADPGRFFRETVLGFPALAPRFRSAAEDGPFHATGPFASRARRITGDGVALVGDAAEFFDPFTGEGVYTALVSAGLLADTITAALTRAAAGVLTARDLQPYAVAHRRHFRGKRLVERMIGYGMLVPALFDRSVNRLQRRGLAPTLLGVTGDFIPARAVLNPVFLAGMVL